MRTEAEVLALLVIKQRELNRLHGKSPAVKFEIGVLEWVLNKSSSLAEKEAGDDD